MGKVFEKEDSEKLVPYIGVLAATIFAFQFVNYPVPGGTSGHLIGGTLVAVILGPWASVIILFLVLIVQSLFGDGGILALGAIRKVPAVIETPEGDFIGIRYKMFLSHSYDHRVVNGALGGMFVKAVKDYLEAWDVNREI